MNDDCLEAQRIVSETYDGVEIPASEIQMAREHCEQCAECTRFVSALAAVRRTPPPQAPKASVEAALQSVRAEKAAEDEASIAAAAAQAAEAQPVSKGQSEAEDGTTARPLAEMPVLRAREKTARQWPKWAAYTSWATAAAATLVVASIVTYQGAAFIGGVSEEAGVDDDGFRLATPSEPNAVGESMTQDTDTQAELAPQASVSYLTIGDWVYVYVGPETAPPSEVTTIATALSALDTGNAPELLNVYSIGSSDAVAVGDGDQLLRFDLVKRTFRGDLYAMKSRAITSFGQWPALPSNIEEPQNPDGSPAFTRGLGDDLGVPVFLLPDTTAEAGFAIAPETSENDPAAGNPNWTWWEKP